MATVSVRYIVDDVDSAIAFYTGHLGFRVDESPPSFGFLGSWPGSSSHEEERALGPPAQILFGDAHGKPRQSRVRRESFQ